MIAKDINIAHTGQVLASLMIGLLLCVWTVLNMQPTVGIIIGLIPFVTLFTFLCINRPVVILAITFILNYTIMGINRYYSIPIPITNIFDLLYGIMLALIFLKQLQSNHNFKKILNAYTCITCIWLLYCIINIGNGITGEVYMEAWLRILRPWALYPILTCIILSIHCNHYTFIHYFLGLWGIITLLAAAKGYWQKNRGFDSTELAWLWAYGARTHFIHSGIRYFSFFTDAAAFGASMGLSCTTFILTFFYTKKLHLKLFYLIVGMAGFYGLLISGTRSALAVPIAGLGLFILLSKNWKICAISSILLFGGVGMLKYTKIGDNNKLIRRMRTVFDANDQSMQVRFENQRALNAYMSEMPFGIGMGVQNGVIPPQNKYYFVSICPPDSSLVDVWIQMGIVGLCVFLGMHAIIFIAGSYILLFKIRNPEIRGPLTGMLCGCAGILVASYANMVYFQFPNGILIYSCFTFIFLGPYLDKLYSEAHGHPAT